MKLVVELIKSDLAKLADPVKAKHSQKFFKTGPGEYGFGDAFLGITVPEQRKVAKKYTKIATLSDIQKLLNSPFHEHRLTALIILVQKYESNQNTTHKKEIVEFYLSNTGNINNWDLVDTTAHKILGDWCLLKQDYSEMYRLIESGYLWNVRIAVISNLRLVHEGEFGVALDICKLVINYDHDLIHKASGWVLREIGKQDKEVLRNFLDAHAKHMPRTMLRYALEKFSKQERNDYLKQVPNNDKKVLDVM